MGRKESISGGIVPEEEQRRCRRSQDDTWRQTKTVRVIQVSSPQSLLETTGGPDTISATRGWRRLAEGATGLEQGSGRDDAVQHGSDRRHASKGRGWDGAEVQGA